MTEQIALRYPPGTKDKIKSVCAKGETMTNAVVRAIDLLSEKSLPIADNEPPTSRLPDLKILSDIAADELDKANALADQWKAQVDKYKNISALVVELREHRAAIRENMILTKL